MAGDDLGNQDDPARVATLVGSELPARSLPTRVRCCSRCRAIYRSDFMRCPTDGAPIDEHEGDPLIGTTLGEHYVIDACVGEGAMGRVYRAHHARLQRRTFAVKVLIGDLASTLAMRLRFTQEAEAASALEHRNVVRVTDFGRSEAGLLYIVMDYVEGVSLADRIDAGRLPVAEVVAIARGLCEGLAHAHDRGLVHRDFKPDNVILADGVPRIVDFGLAIASDADGEAARLTSVGAAVGTPAYAAPEQASGAAVDHRADLFSLGVTLYEMLAGALPFVGNIAELIYQNATAEPPPLATRAPGAQVPAGLEAIVRRLMARKPADRFADARAVIAALDAIDLSQAAVVAVPAPPAVASSPAPSPAPAPASTAPAAAAPRRRWPLAIAGAAVVLTAGIAVLLPTRGHRRRLVAPLSPGVALVDAGAPASLDATDPGTRAALLGDPIDASVPSDPIDAPAVVAIVTPPEPRPGVRPPRAALIDAGTPSPLPGAVDAAPPPPPPLLIDAGPPPPPPPRAIDAGAPAPRPVIVDARAAIAGLDVKGSLSRGQVDRTIGRLTGAFAACYRPAATRAGRSPATAVQVRCTIEEDGSVRGVSTSGGLPGMGACVAAALAGVRSTVAPDVGTVAVAFTVTYQPEQP